MTKKIKAALLAALLWAVGTTAFAEDIDLFASPPSSVTFLPNVLIVLDNTANWNSAFSNEMAALKAVFNALPANKFRVGLVMYDETGSGNTTTSGAYVRAAIRTLTSTTQPLYSALVSNFDQNADSTNGRALGLAMAEAYLYYSGGTAYGGSGQVKRDYQGNSVPGSKSQFPFADAAATNAIYAQSGNAFQSATGNASGVTTYTSPVQDGCQRNFIIYIGNTTSGGDVTKDNTNQNTTSGTLLGNAGGDTTQVANISPAGMSDNYANEWTRFMKRSTYAITTYTIDVTYCNGCNNNGPDNSALLKSMADEGGGKYFKIAAATTTDLSGDIQRALGSILSEIQSVNSVFASVSLPVSVNTQGSYLNQVYIGMFRPDPGDAPRWAGNLKQYKLGLVSGVLQLQDATSTSAINSGTGFITECARSFWTPSTTDTYWAYLTWPTGTTFCLSPPSMTATYQGSNFPDGNIVEKGAAAYKLRSTTARTMYTCGSTMAACTSTVAFNTTNVTPTSLGLASTDTTTRDQLVSWALGLDVDDDNHNGVTTTEMRPSAHGDVVHSRPVAVNFVDSATTAATSNVVVFYGGNDGVLRAVNGNRGDIGVTNIGSYSPGSELWSFMPPEAYGNIKRLRDNTTLVQIASETYGTGVSVAPKPYGMDGPITAFRGTVGGATKSFVYSTMRRGGRSVYAFDVSTILTAPNSPTFKWRIGCSTSLGATTQDCSTGMSNMAQSWASLKAFTTAGYTAAGGATKPLMIFGGGYDTCEDYDALSAGGANNNCTSSNKGGSVFVVDADTGAVVKEFVTGFNRGVIADVTLVRDSTGNAILAYAADLAGNVYRITFGTSASTSWTMQRIAALGCDTVTTCTANRKFMFAPSVVTTDVISLNATYQVLLGSGDREKPISYYASANAVSNYFFQFTDKPGDSTYPGTLDCGSSLICLNSLYSIAYNGTSPTSTQLAAKKGWALAFASSEQAVTSAVTIYGVTTFSTHKPATATGSCTSNLGTTLVYSIGYNDASAVNGGTSRAGELAGDGLPPSPVAGQVTLDDGTTVPFCIGCSTDSPLQGKLPTSLAGTIKPKSRLYWFIEK